MGKNIAKNEAKEPFCGAIFAVSEIMFTFASMKVIAFILTFCMAFTLSSCHGNPYPQGLVAADSIAEHDARRAQAMLDSLKPLMAAADEPTHNYYALMCIKVADKAYKPLPTDSTVFNLVKYYEKRQDKRLLPVAYYYAGRTLFLRNNAPAALDYYQKALDLIEGKDDFLRLKRALYSQMGYIFFYQNLFEKSLNMSRKALSCSMRLGDKRGQIYNLEDIGGYFSDLKKNDSSEIYYKRALNLAKSENSKEHILSVCSQLAFFYVYKMRDYVKAKKFLDMALEYNGNVKERKLLAISAKVYEGMGMQDSAYQENLRLWKMDNLYSRKSACRDIANYKIKKGKGDEALAFLRKYEECLDSIDAITATEKVAQMDAMYNYSSKEKEVAELKVERANYQRVIIVTVSIMGLAVLLLVVVWLLMRTKTLSVTVNTEKQRKLKLINQLTETKEEKHKQVNDELHSTKIYHTITERLDDDSVKNKRLSDDEWREVDEAICSRIKNFKRLINETCKVSEQEYRVCLLLKLGISLSGIAEITNKSRSAISLTRRRLYERAFGEEKNAADCWDRFILSL